MKFFFSLAQSNEDESWWESMRVATLASVWVPTLIHSQQLSSTLINFELVQILMRVDKSLCAFDRSWELMRVAKVLAVCFKNLFKLLVVHSLQLWVSLILSSSIIFVCWPTPPANSHQLSSLFDWALSYLIFFKCKTTRVAGGTGADRTGTIAGLFFTKRGFNGQKYVKYLWKRIKWHFGDSRYKNSSEKEQRMEAWWINPLVSLWPRGNCYILTLNSFSQMLIEHFYNGREN